MKWIKLTYLLRLCVFFGLISSFWALFVLTVTTFIRRSQGYRPFLAGDSNLSTRRRFAARKSILSQIFSARGKVLWSPHLVKCSLAKYPRAFSWKWAFSHSMSKIPSFGKRSWFWKSTRGLGPRSNLSRPRVVQSTHVQHLPHPDSGITHSTIVSINQWQSEATRRDTGDKQTGEFDFFCGVFRERYKMFSKVKRPLEIERDSSPKRAKSRKGPRYSPHWNMKE